MEARKAETKVVATVLALAALCVFSLFVVAGNLEPSGPPGDNEISYELAKKVAAHYANLRWDSVHIGQGQIYCAPDGTPEVYFFVVFKDGTPDRSEAELLGEVAALMSRRIEIEKGLEDMPKDVAKNRTLLIRNLWSQMSGADKYSTVVVGAHEGREPFIASYSGLPPHVFLREDAIETARLKLRGRRPNNIRHIWQPPLFVAFEVSEEREVLDKVQLEVKGTKLHQIKTLMWERPKLQDKVMQKRKQKWQSWRRSLSEN